MDRVFLDANVIFSAAYRPSSRLRELWLLPETMLISSLYAIEEARRNLIIHKPNNLSGFNELIGKIEIVSVLLSEISLPDGINLPEKDVPILSAAVASGCTHLLTGAKQHFDALFGKSVGGVLVLVPSEYIRRVM